jgi:Fe(3+) dicitrate transport protein
MDYENQIVPASLAGGIGTTLTNAGETLHEGAELAGRWDVRNIFRTRNHVDLRGAYMYLPVARFSGTRFSGVPGSADVTVTGHRLPYAPRSLLNAIAGWSHSTGINAFLEAVQTGRQFADDLNTVNPTPDGQRGAIPGHVLWNATLNVPIEGRHTSLFLTVKNLLDRTVIVDRSRGILPNSPRLIQSGLQFSF